MLTILNGDAATMLRTLPDESVQTCVTSPPYWALRSYGVGAAEGEIGQETTPGEYVADLVQVFAEVRRVLKPDGTLWCNLGDCYASESSRGLKAKDLIGIPWMVAFALRDAGWYLRSEITWLKRVPMPESVRDRPTSATEKIFLLSKSARYHYDSDAVRQPPSESFAEDRRWQSGSTDKNMKNGYESAGAQNPKRLHKIFDKQRGHSRRHAGFNDRWDQMEKSEQMANGCNMRNYWLLSPAPFKGEHYATFPPEVPRRAILAGCPVGETVLDPFAGSGTTGQVALELGRKAILIELNTEYCKLAAQRCHVTPGLAI